MDRGEQAVDRALRRDVERAAAQVLDLDATLQTPDNAAGLDENLGLQAPAQE